MKRITILTTIILSMASLSVKAQESMPVPEEFVKVYNLPDDGQSLEKPEWKQGTAVLKGRFSVCPPDNKQAVTVSLNNPILGGQKSYSCTIAMDGSFRVEVPMIQNYQSAFTHIGPYYGVILLEADKETNVFLDSKTGKLYFTGSFADVNNAISTKLGHDIIWDHFDMRNKKYLRMSPVEIKTEIMNYNQKRTSAIDSLP